MRKKRATAAITGILAIGCPRALHRIEPEVCGMMQDRTRAKCERVNNGLGCEWLDCDGVITKWNNYQSQKNGSLS